MIDIRTLVLIRYQIRLKLTIFYVRVLRNPLHPITKTMKDASDSYMILYSKVYPEFHFNQEMGPPIDCGIFGFKVKNPNFKCYYTEPFDEMKNLLYGAETSETETKKMEEKKARGASAS